eukprot:CAMPEP_0197645884 /NCGR_PEP_ID=MMETSP1338-20131121/21011_1 /TAXON_ID=43686 ORGANISM="Pelagodinium beii, Strain RCC1491" /NCGR_SAMPLE_ID=MMETSP1338 /ASSEMBLY_ACC=CAM_ASM_000754 /LENGTH=85 /DNA_ID=CAMNT_0043219451 /DNA_START=66 /DNA_END=320 /DNA_ORIENTATION=+
MAPRRRVLSALTAGAALAYALSSGISFVGSNGRDAGSLVTARVGVDYQARQGPRDADTPFTSSAASGPGAVVEFKKRPFGILRYT